MSLPPDDSSTSPAAELLGIATVDPTASFRATAEALRDKLKLPPAPIGGPVAILLTASPLGDQDAILACDLCGAVIAASKLDQHFEYHSVVLHSSAAAGIFRPFLIGPPDPETPVDQPAGPVPAVSPPPPVHDHFPIPHRDGKEPWCPVCQLNPDYNEPRLLADKPDASAVSN